MCMLCVGESWCMLSVVDGGLVHVVCVGELVYAVSGGGGQVHVMCVCVCVCGRAGACCEQERGAGALSVGDRVWWCCEQGGGFCAF
ncbi:hypothetical protein GDO81_003471 [Engystomops pustulosus]|uniref:Secreted protein n=1 Tax=Engystomops pustulosus TaxID=76066 RepID=A0AAV6ZWS3_ENGPU|nr:hypothetical protein GDO81_003471 [Engystomops pustulosus]